MTEAYRLSREAHADLDGIWKYIARDNSTAADRFLDRLHSKFAMLSRQPLLGEPRDELGTGLRSFPAGNYVIYYRPTQGRIKVELARVIHGARDITGMF